MPNTWIQTASGRKFWPLSPRECDVCIEDIAHALANKCRFTGHTRSFYSVAQHCVLCSQIVPHFDALCALLHDATEAYLPDVARPVKAELHDFRQIEDRLHRVIGRVFGLPWPFPESVKRADNTLLVTERRDLMTGNHEWEWAKGIEPLDQPIVPWGPIYARRRFLERYEELTFAVAFWSDTKS